VGEGEASGLHHSSRCDAEKAREQQKVLAVIVYGLRRVGGPVRYIGQTSKTLSQRFSAHKYWARKKMSKLPVHCWMRKHQDVEIFLIKDNATINDDEIVEIRSAKARGEALLNCTDGGSGMVGWKASERTRSNISRGRSGIANPREAIVRTSRARRVLNDDQVVEAKRLRSTGQSYYAIALVFGVSWSAVRSAINALRPCYRAQELFTTPILRDTQNKLKDEITVPFGATQRRMVMADNDEKTQRLIDRAVKTERKNVLKIVNEQIAAAVAEAKDIEDKGAKKAVGDALKALKTAIKDATAE
jgi:hypothetical protein